mgnify:FL=1
MPREQRTERLVACADVLRSRAVVQLKDVAFATRLSLHDAAEFTRDPIVRDSLARMLGARRVEYTRSKRHLGSDRIAAVF